MANHVTPSTDKAAFNCSSCGAMAAQTWYEIFVSELGDGKTPQIWTSDNIDIDGETALARRMRFSELQNPVERVIAGEILWAPKASGPGGRYIVNLHLSECFNCKRLSVWHSNRQLVPSTGGVEPPNADLPPDIRNDYEEAASILNQSPRGAAAILRLVLQKLCKHLGEKGDNINADIQSLVANGLDSRIQKMLDVVRVVGNNAVHPGQLDLRDDRETAASLFRFVNLIAERMITEARKLDEAYSALPEAARKGITQRDQKKS